MRTREEIEQESGNSIGFNSVVITPMLILEVLLDIRDLLTKHNNHDK